MNLHNAQEYLFEVKSNYNGTFVYVIENNLDIIEYVRTNSKMSYRETAHNLVSPLVAKQSHLARQ